MDYVKEKTKVEITDEMVSLIEELLDGLDQLKEVVAKNDFTIQNSHDDEIWFDLTDLLETIKLLKTLTEPTCEFVE